MEDTAELVKHGNNNITGCKNITGVQIHNGLAITFR